MGTNVSIRPSALGTKGLLLFCAMELAFLATNYSNLFFMVLAFSAVLGVLGAVWSIRNVQGLRIDDVTLGMAAADTSRAIQLQVDGGKRARFDLTFEMPLHGGVQAIGYAPLVRGHATVHDAMPGQPRSLQQMQHVHVRSRFPFGFFIARTRLPVDGEVITHPKPVPFGDEGGRHAASDDGSLLIAGRGSTLAGLRAFRQGDMLGDVHWKATARRGNAVVKERERESDPEVDVVLDRRCDPASLESALSQLTSLVMAARHGCPLRIYSQGVEMLVDPDRGGAKDALRWLAEAGPVAAIAGEPPGPRSAIQLPTSGRLTR